MAPRRNLPYYSIFDYKILEIFKENNIKELHVWKLWSYIIRNPDALSLWENEDNYNDIINDDMPKAAKAILNSKFKTSTSKVIDKQVSRTGETIKLLIELQDGLKIETVIMIYDTTSDDPYDRNAPIFINGQKRATICVSSQIGCRMGCKFCATGTMGLKGNLTSGEIIEQLVHVKRIFGKFRNVVFMGMGEPLDNYENVRDSIKLITDSKLFAIAKSRVTISTVGIHHKFDTLAHDLPGISLAFSLHAPNQKIRESIVPSARIHKLDSLMTSLQHFCNVTSLKIFVEYVMLNDINDSIENAKELALLLLDLNVVVNLIPYNPIIGEGKFMTPNMKKVIMFKNELLLWNIKCTIRQEKGRDISGACGQLVSYNDDIEDLC